MKHERGIKEENERKKRSKKVMFCFSKTPTVET
jgi:hypothetical protein